MVTTIEKYYSNLKQRLESLGMEGICLDIDDTLSDTNLFWAKHHLKNFGNPEQLTAEEIIHKYRYVSNVPYWNNNPDAEKWIIQNCESPVGRRDVLPVMGAIEGVTELQAFTNLVAYLTGRTQPVVEATRQWLDKYGFPNLEILAQPSQETLEEMCLSNAHEWKARVLDFLFPQVTGIIEDNANLIQSLSLGYEGTIFLFSHSDTIDTPLDVICCPTWNDVVLQVRRKKEFYNDSVQIASAYDAVAEDFLSTRTQGNGISGFGHREIEQPYMFGMVPEDLTNMRLLELGCGPGIHAREYVNRGAEVTGVDLSREMVSLAKKTCPLGDFRVGNVYHLRFEDEYFDMVTSSLLLDHIQDLDKLFEEVHRVLKKRGEFIFSVPHPMINLFDQNLRINKSYFESTPHYFSVAGNPTKIKAYQHQLMEYFQIPIRKGFVLQDFVENQPDSKWQENYENLDRCYLVMPQQCFFKWIKS